jgi:hypothetical protein
MNTLLQDLPRTGVAPFNSKPILQWYFFVGLCCIFSVIPRIILIDTQVDWDEELYFQIGRNWSLEVLPYRDIFDHKPPIVYLIFKLFSIDGISMAFVRATFLLILVSSSFRLWWVLRDRLNMFFMPTFLLVLSAPGIAGTNTEILYIPFIMLFVSEFVAGHRILSALAAAIALNIKYTTGLDILGASLFLFFLKNEDWMALLKTLIAAGACAGFIWLSFYLYFISFDINILRNSLEKLPSFIA